MPNLNTIHFLPLCGYSFRWITPYKVSCSTNWAKRSFHISKNLVTRKAYLRFAPLTGNFYTSHICNWWDIKLLTPGSDIPFNTPADAAILYLVALFVSVPATIGTCRWAKRDFVFQRTFLLYYKNRANFSILVIFCRDRKIRTFIATVSE